MDCSGNYYFLDGTIYERSEETFDSGADVSFYEVIRTSKGIPWFFDDHIKRLTDGISTRYVVPDGLYDYLRAGINALAGKEPFQEKNLMITLSFTGHEYSIHICFIESSYPDPWMYEKGIRLITYRAERFDPGVKMLNTRLRLSVNEELKLRNAYEALLVNHDGYITEGSRSNVFFIDNNDTIFTPPDDLVLPGVTRKQVIEILHENDVKLEFEKIKASEISLFRSVFISGTSPMILSANSIDKTSFFVNSPVVLKIRECYLRKAQLSMETYNSKI